MTEALARRMPTTIVGSAAGRITADSCCGGARIVRADVIRSGSTCFTAAIVLSRSDQAQLYISHRDLEGSRMSRNRMKIRQYRERCGVLADLGELLQEISEPGAPSDAEAKRDDQGDRHQKSAQGTQHARRDVVVQFFCLRTCHPPAGHLRERRQEHRIGQAEVRSRLPHRQRHEEQDGGMPEYGEPAYDRTDPVQTWLVPSGLSG
ncbi:hypothetical protein ACVWXM_010012 [Bradyrhizobium sp. GM7.3]